jgi:putative transposase
MLHPNNKQQTRFFQYAGASRFAYNWTLQRQEEEYKNTGKYLSDSDLRKEFTILRHLPEYKWLEDINVEVTKQVIKDACNAYIRYFKRLTNKPKFKAKKRNKSSFYQNGAYIKFTDTHIKLALVTGQGKANSRRGRIFNQVRLAEKGKIPINVGYQNVRVTYDGLNWWVSVSFEVIDLKYVDKKTDGLGIDVGIKNLAICSDGTIYKNINKTVRVKKIEKKKRRLQRSISRKYTKNKKGDYYCKTSNIIKSERELLKVNKRLANIRKNYLHQTTTEIIKREPNFICIEDLNVNGMMKNRHLSKAIQQQGLYEFRRQIGYKSNWHNIPLILADKFYPSSKLCNNCGNINHSLKLSDRIYKCSVCGYTIDRDLNASLNLKSYGFQHLQCSI